MRCAEQTDTGRAHPAAELAIDTGVVAALVCLDCGTRRIGALRGEVRVRYLRAAAAMQRRTDAAQ